MKSKSQRPAPPPETPRRVTLSHVVLFAAGMVLMLLLESLFWPGRGLVWHQTTAHKTPAPQILALPPLPPWGRLEYVPIALDRPESYFTNDVPDGAKTWWVFRNHTEQQLAAYLGSLELSQPTRAYLLDQAHWEMLPRAIRLAPPPEIVVSLGPETRRRLYEILGHNPENAPQARPFRFRADGFDTWFADCGLPPDKLELVRQLTYRQQNNLCFADAAAFSQLASPAEVKCLVKTLWRVSTFILKVKIEPDTDVNTLVKYWGTLGMARTYRPFIDSMSRVPEGSSLNISYFLPPFARLRLYTYPDPRDPNILRQDCFWTGMNFFNGAPDNGFFNPEYTRAALQSDYARVRDQSKQFGDLLMLVSKDEQALHLCVYLADGVVFTKNGADIQQPWVLMKLEEMLGEYESARPYDIVTYRRKTPPPISSLSELSSAARTL